MARRDSARRVLCVCRQHMHGSGWTPPPPGAHSCRRNGGCICGRQLPPRVCPHSLLLQPRPRLPQCRPVTRTLARPAEPKLSPTHPSYSVGSYALPVLRKATHRPPESGRSRESMCRHSARGSGYYRRHGRRCVGRRGRCRKRRSRSRCRSRPMSRPRRTCELRQGDGVAEWA